jgi:Cu(I)/Ag(I) efflux system membrane fusion protein
MSPHIQGVRRRVAIGGVAVLITGAAIWGIAVSRRGSDSRTKVRGTTAEMQGMAGMAGMSGPGDGTVVLSAAQIRQFGVTFGAVEVRPLTTEVRTTGVVTADETRIAQVAPKFGGFVERLHVNFTGQPVRRGQPLLEIYSPELVAAQQELLVAGDLQRDIGRSAVPGVPEGSTNLVEAAKRRLRLWDISEGQIDEVLRTGRARRTLTLYAPVSGVVMEKKVVQGQSIMPGEQLYTIADLSTVWVDIELREGDLAAVRVGSSADLEFAGLPGRLFKGRVQYVYPTLQPEARTLRARVAVANTDGALKPGMYATARLSTPTRSALTVLSSAVLRTGDRNVVFVDMGQGALMPHDVELGRTAGDYTEVLSGLEPGQRVVTSAQFLLDSESNLGEVMKSMIGQMSSGDLGKTQEMKDMPGMSMPGMNDKGAKVRPTEPAPTPRR